MDRSLDETIAERMLSNERNRNRDRRLPPRRNNYPRDGVRKSTRDSRANLENDWVHDRYDDDDDRDGKPDSYRNRNRVRSRRDDYDEDWVSEPEDASSTAKIRVENLHYDITRGELEDLFQRIGRVNSVELIYDRAGRSTGTAYVVYSHVANAEKAIDEYDGANAKGQPIRLDLLSPSAPAAIRSEPRIRRGNPFDRVENPRSLFDRVEVPKSKQRRARSASPDDGRGYGARRSGGGRDPTSRDRRGDISKHAPNGIDRYVPGRDHGRSTSRRGHGGVEGRRRPGERRERGGERAGRDGRDSEGHRLVNGRPRKTQEELDAEMEDYWGNARTPEGAASTNGAAPAAHTTQVAQAAVTGDEDIDMIE